MRRGDRLEFDVGCTDSCHTTVVHCVFFCSNRKKKPENANERDFCEEEDWGTRNALLWSQSLKYSDVLEKYFWCLILRKVIRHESNKILGILSQGGRCLRCWVSRFIYIFLIKYSNSVTLNSN